MHAFYADHFVLPLPEGHRFPMAKYRLLRDRLSQELPDIRLLEAPAATPGELALAHDPAYVDAVLNGQLSAQALREIGFPWSPAMAERACRSVGATVAACRRALAGEGVAANLAGGTHHAYADRGGGFCVFNDMAVAARLMQAEAARAHRASRQPVPPFRVAIVDLDVHQGNGTAHLFRDDPSVFTLSMHGAKNFPFRKEASDLDVELPDGCTDAPYLAALAEALAALHQHGVPDLLLYLAGADAHEGDRLGRLKLSTDGMAERDRMGVDWAWARQVPVVFAMGGGYGHRMEDTVAVQVNTYRQGLALFSRWQNRAGLDGSPAPGPTPSPRSPN